MTLWIFLFLLIVNLGGAFISAGIEGNSITITSLTAPVTLSETTSISVTSTSGFPSANHYMQLGQEEIICYGSKTTTTFNTLTRGASRSLCLTGSGPRYNPVSHNTGVRVYQRGAGTIAALINYDVVTSIDTAGNVFDKARAGLKAVGAFITAIPDLISWNYSIFDGDFLGLPLVYLQFVLFCFSTAFALLLIFEFIRIFV